MDAYEPLLRPGHRLDRYELLAPIASGGMATVWLARMRGKRGFEKLFAIKTIRTELVGDPRFQEMFLDEARIASGIQHPNVAQILDLGEQDDVLYLVMEWVGGESLDKVRHIVSKRGGVLPIGVTLRILADACAGLHAAHELRDNAGEPLGIIHRDVSPQNILVSTSGAVKVIDFGIAKAQHRRQGETGIGIVKGKIHYMAPEQVKKERKIDRRTDIWALGVCLHELVTGKLPFDEDDDVEVIRKLVANEAPSAREGISPPVQRVLDRSLALLPDARFPTATAMQRALEAAMVELDESKTSDDVAAFLRTECPELEQRRKALVARAMEAVPSPLEPPPPSSSVEEAAFAPTLIGETEAMSRKGGPTPPPARVSSRPPPSRRTDSDAPAIALTRRKMNPTPPLAFPATNASIALDRDSVPPRKSRSWLWAVVLLGGAGAVAFFRFPAQTQRVLGAIGLTQAIIAATAVTPASPPTSSTAAAPPPVASTGTAAGSAAASSSASSAPAVAAPSAQPSGSALAVRAAAPDVSGSASAGHRPPAPSARPGSDVPPASSGYSIYKGNPVPGPAPSASAAPLPGPGDYLH